MRVMVRPAVAARVTFLALLVATSVACENERQRERERAEREAEAIRRGAADIVAREQARAARVGDVAASYVVDQVQAAEARFDQAVALGRTVKAELDKVYRSDGDYELAVARGPAAADDAARFAALPHVQVGAVTVGYQEERALSVRGVRYARHFRASWRRGDEVVQVGYFGQETVDAAAFAALLPRLVPLVERQLP